MNLEILDEIFEAYVVEQDADARSSIQTPVAELEPKTTS